MFAVGHLALGYLAGKAASKLLNAKANVPLLFLASVLPDVDLLLGLEHRGPTHSLIVISLFFLPVFIIYRKEAVPYFVAIIQHSLLGDFLVGGGTQLLWPASVHWYAVGIGMASLTNILMEWAFFFASLIILVKTKDALTLFQHHHSNRLLSIPIFTVLLPSLLSFPLSVPSELIIPHLIYLTIFTYSVLIDFTYILRTRPP